LVISVPAATFLLNDVKVGKNSQSVAPGSVAAETFGPTSFGVRLHTDTGQVSMIITANVTNISLAGARFLGTIFGASVE